MHSDVDYCNNMLNNLIRTYFQNKIVLLLPMFSDSAFFLFKDVFGLSFTARPQPYFQHLYVRKFKPRWISPDFPF